MFITMTAATARKKRATEPDEPTQQGTKQTRGLWFDESLLPTNIAKKGSPKNEKIIEFPFSKPELAKNRILRLADILLGNPKGTPVIERRTTQKKFKGAERRSTR